MDVTLRTARLVLRPPVIADAAAIVRLLNNFSVVGRPSRVPSPYTEADAHWWLEHNGPNSPATETNFAIDLAGEGLIGVCGFHPDLGGTVLGYWLGEPFWNRGFMSEAAEAVITWYFAATAAETLGCGAFAFNKASLAVQRKLGFTESGLSSRHCLARHQDLRHIDTQLTRDRWAERSATRQLQANP